jgi:hypothetical protein
MFLPATTASNAEDQVAGLVSSCSPSSQRKPNTGQADPRQRQSKLISSRPKTDDLSVRSSFVYRSARSGRDELEGQVGGFGPEQHKADPVDDRQGVVAQADTRIKTS